MSGKTKKCANCQGTGKIVYWDYAAEGAKPWLTPPAVADDKPCYRCNGTGKEKIE